MSEPVELTVADLAGLGDGVGASGGRTIFVPFTVPGDRVRVLAASERAGVLRASRTELIEPGPDRAPPLCRHFGACGGCTLQHVSASAYARWKRGRVEAELRRHDLVDVPVGPSVQAAPGTRRRARLTAVGRKGGGVLGFNARSSHLVVDVRECHVLTAPLLALLPPLRKLVTEFFPPGEKLTIDMLDLDGATDLLFTTALEPTLALRAALAVLAESRDVARISWDHGDGAPAEPIVARAPVRATFGRLAVDIPPAAFVQPTATGEAALRQAVLGELRDEARVLELFAGCGTFSLPMIEAGARVYAIEGEGGAAEALRSAARRPEAGGRLSVETRDLARAPVVAAAMTGYDLIVLDPPRTGAAAQVAEIASSPVPRLVYVSCNPASFAKDARRLADGGYRLEGVLPVDQFLWSPHLELVGVFAHTRATAAAAKVKGGGP